VTDTAFVIQVTDIDGGGYRQKGPSQKRVALVIAVLIFAQEKSTRGA
jgi:hypothetical protein